MIKKNLSYIISYLLIILCFLLGAIFYRQAFLAILLLLCCVLPPISIGLTHHVITKISYDITCPVQNLQAGNDVILTLKMKNTSIFPLLNCKIDFHYENLFYKNATQHNLFIPAEPRKESYYKLPFQTLFAGYFTFVADSFCVTDYLHLYTFCLPFSKEIKFPVLPKVLDLQLPTLPKSATDDDEKLFDSKKGTPSSEILQLREYRPGDRLQNIHWKMSAKADTLLVKEFDSSLDLHYVILPELTGNNFQEMLSLYYTLGLSLLKKREFFKVAIYHSNDRIFSLMDITDEDLLCQSLFRLYYEPVVSCQSLYSQLCSQYSFTSGIVCIRGSKLYFGETEVALA